MNQNDKQMNNRAIKQKEKPMLEKKEVIIATVLSLILVATIAFAEPVYTEGESYQIEVLEDGQMQVRKATRVYRDDTDDGIDNGVEISKTYHRHVLSPGADVTEEVERVQDISKAVWTEDTIKKYEDKQKKNEPIEEELIIGE